MPDPAPVANPKWMWWTGCALTALTSLMLTAGAVGQILKAEPAVKEFERLGWPNRVAPGLGVVKLTCAVLCAIPQTSVLGAILATGYLGGAVAAHVRIGDDFIAPIVIGVLIWLGLFLRDPRLRALVPWRS